jgi:cyclomaltodextrinase / maltogenic alpha-amylase / neopullulanase
MRIAALLFLTACTGVAHPDVAELELYGAEVWTFETRLEGRADVELAQCRFELDGVPHDARVTARTFAAQLALQPEHTSQLRAQCTSADGRRLSSPTVTLQSRASASPTARASVRSHGGQLSLDGRSSSANEATRAALVSYEWRRDGELLGGEPTLAVARRDGTYQLRVRDASGREDVSRVQLADGVPVERARWLAGGTVYGVVPPLYGQPPLAAVRQQLDALRELGVRALWLSPVFRTIEGDFGYAVTDSFHVRDDYGGDAALDALIHAAHARGLRVLLDLVINHSSAEHRYFREASLLGERSHYFDFYDRDPAGQATHYFDWTHLPNYDYQNPEVVAWALAYSRLWIERGVDGYRVDAAWGVRQRSPAFYDRWSAELRRIRPDAFLLAEAPARDPYYREHGFDAGYDWTEELGHHAWEHVFEPQPGIAERLAAAVKRSPDSFHFLNNNDTGERFITRHGIALTRVATVALMTLPGIPCLYAFDEVGAAYQPYQEDAPHNLHPELRDFHRQLIATRRDTPAFRGDVYRELTARGELYVFTRGEGREQVTVALNFGATPVEVDGAVLEPYGYRLSGGL